VDSFITLAFSRTGGAAAEADGADGADGAERDIDRNIVLPGGGTGAAQGAGGGGGPAKLNLAISPPPLPPALDITGGAPPKQSCNALFLQKSKNNIYIYIYNIKEAKTNISTKKDLKLT
jgi:hypothetical protein